MARGRPPNSPNLKLVQGNPGRRPIPEPGPEVAEGLRKPLFLRGRAAELFEEVEPLCPWLRAPDSHALAIWAKLVVEAERSVAKMPASRLAQLRGLAAELGLTPGSRARLGPVSPPPKKTAASQFFDD